MRNINAFLGLLLLLLSGFDYFNIIEKKYCSVTCLQNYDGLGFNWFLLLLIAFVISLLLSFHSQYLHRKWWKFARIAIPVILIISTVINLGFHHTNYGPMQLDDIFDIPAHIVMYLVFIIGSIVQIVRGYRTK